MRKKVKKMVDEKNNGGFAAPPWAQDNQRIDVNLIAMLLWQSLLTGTAVTVSHLDWYLPNASPAEMGLQYGLIAFGFLCTAMVLFHVGGIRDSLALRAELSQEHRHDKWQRGQMRLQQRRQQKQQGFIQGTPARNTIFGNSPYPEFHPMQQNQPVQNQPVQNPSSNDNSEKDVSNNND